VRFFFENYFFFSYCTITRDRVAIAVQNSAERRTRTHGKAWETAHDGDHVGEQRAGVCSPSKHRYTNTAQHRLLLGTATNESSGPFGMFLFYFYFSYSLLTYTTG
jgi:hypothetical protein